jgi:cell division septum initiation protein DivIVA
LSQQSTQDFYAQSIGSLKSQIQNYREQLEQYSEQLSEGDAKAQLEEMTDYYYELEGSIVQAAQDHGIQDHVNEAAQSTQQKMTEFAQGAAQQAQDTAGQAADQAQQVAGQATDQAGQVAGQAQDAAGQATQQAQDFQFALRELGLARWAVAVRLLVRIRYEAGREDG